MKRIFTFTVIVSLLLAGCTAAAVPQKSEGTHSTLKTVLSDAVTASSSLSEETSSASAEVSVRKILDADEYSVGLWNAYDSTPLTPEEYNPHIKSNAIPLQMTQFEFFSNKTFLMTDSGAVNQLYYDNGEINYFGERFPYSVYLIDGEKYLFYKIAKDYAYYYFVFLYCGDNVTDIPKSVVKESHAECIGKWKICGECTVEFEDYIPVDNSDWPDRFIVFDKGYVYWFWEGKSGYSTKLAYSGNTIAVNREGGIAEFDIYSYDGRKLLFMPQNDNYFVYEYDGAAGEIFPDKNYSEPSLTGETTAPAGMEWNNNTVTEAFHETTAPVQEVKERKLLSGDNPVGKWVSYDFIFDGEADFNPYYHHYMDELYLKSIEFSDNGRYSAVTLDKEYKGDWTTGYTDDKPYYIYLIDGERYLFYTWTNPDGSFFYVLKEE